jgi:hypothetical protein
MVTPKQPQRMAHRIYRNGNGIVVFLILTAQMGLLRRTRGSAARRRPVVRSAPLICDERGGDAAWGVLALMSKPVILTVDDDPAVSAAIARLATI